MYLLEGFQNKFKRQIVEGESRDVGLGYFWADFKWNKR